MTFDICAKCGAINKWFEKHKVFEHNQTNRVWFFEKLSKDEYLTPNIP